MAGSSSAGAAVEASSEPRRGRQDDLRVRSGGLDDAVALVRNSFNRVLVSGELWVKLVIVTNSTIDAQSVNVRALSVAVAPLFLSWFTVGGLLTTHRTGCTFAFCRTRVAC